MCIHVQWVHSTEVAISRRDTAKFGTLQSRVFPSRSREKKVRSVEVSRCN